MDKFEEMFMDALRDGDIDEYYFYESAMDNLLAFRAGQSDLPDRKKRRRFNKIDPKHRKDQRHEKGRLSVEWIRPRRGWRQSL